MSPPSPPSLYPPFLVQEGVPDAPGGADYDMEVDEEARGAAGADATAATARAVEAGGSRDPAEIYRVPYACECMWVWVCAGVGVGV